MSYRIIARSLSILLIIVSFCLMRPAPGSAASIVLGSVEYTRDGVSDNEAKDAIETYLMLFLSRLPHGKPQTGIEYLRACRSPDASGEPFRPCPFPDFLIQLQLSERAGEVHISGAVRQKTGSTDAGVLDAIRVKARNLTDGLSYAAKGIDAIISSANPALRGLTSSLHASVRVRNCRMFRGAPRKRERAR